MKLCVLCAVIIGLYAILMSYNKYTREKGSRKIIEAGIVPESIEGYNPLSPFAKATEDMFSYKS